MQIDWIDIATKAAAAALVAAATALAAALNQKG